ncbi:MAG TPA: GxxExxY protein [Methylomirabilota bacterium]|nr:GxxExxY protein [Methylomirabilota bacterium]
MELLFKDLTGKILGAAMEVHKELGCGFLEALYQEAFEHELKLRKIKFVRQKPHRVAYKGIILRHPYIPDLIVEEKVVVDLKAIREIGAIEEAQMINYLKITNLKVGLIVNFGCRSLEWKRLVLSESPVVDFKNPRNLRFQNLSDQSL